MTKVRIWWDFVVAAVAACRHPKSCTSCNETTYTS